MSESLDKALAIWHDEKQLETIKAIYAPKLSDGEFKTFVQMGMSTGLNPFLREIWAVKYDQSAPAQIFIGRDGYRKAISRNERYDCHVVDAVYSNDTYSYSSHTGEVKHICNFKDRGHVVGAYCLVYMKGSTRPFYSWAELAEYDTNRSLWKDKKATMIKKVAECQTIRMAMTALNGTYDEIEVAARPEGKADKLNNLMGLTPEKKEVIDHETGEVAVAEIIAHTFEEIVDMMELSQSNDELLKVVPFIQSSGFTQDQKDALKEVFKVVKAKFIVKE